MQFTVGYDTPVQRACSIDAAYRQRTDTKTILSYMRFCLSKARLLGSFFRWTRDKYTKCHWHPYQVSKRLSSML